jgi:hypothetical protein
LVHDLVRETHRLRANLKSYFPQALTLAGSLDTVMACDFLGRWWSLASLQRSSERSIKDFYRKHGSRANDQQRARGVGRWATLRALGYKWVRILFRCWQSRTPYDETRYVAALKKTGSPLVPLLAA